MKKLLSVFVCAALFSSVFFTGNTCNFVSAANAVTQKYKTIGADIYLPYGKTVLDINNEFTDVDFSAKDQNETEKYKYLFLEKDDKLKVKIDDSETEYSIKLIGDLSCNGILTVLDITKIRKLILDGDNMSENIIKADTNGDGEITVTDLCDICDSAVSKNEIEYNSGLKDRLETVYSNNLNILCGSSVFSNSYSKTDFSNMINKSIVNYGNATRVANVMRKALTGEAITVVVFGGSITQGAGASQNYAVLLNNWLNTTFGARCDINIKYVNSGIGSTDTVFAAHRVYQDVLSYSPDLVIMEFCVNDSLVNEYKAGTYESTVRRILSTDAALIMLSMACSGGQTSEPLHLPIAKAYDVPMISYKTAYFNTDFFNSTEYLLSDDRTHPNTTGHYATFMLLQNYFTNVYKDLPNIGYTDSMLPKTTVYGNGGDYINGRIVDLCNLKKTDNVTVTSKGAFLNNKDFTSTPKFNAPNNKYFCYNASATEVMTSVKPLTVTINNCKNLFIEMLREPTGCNAKVEILENGAVVNTVIVDSNFSYTHIWATEQLYHSTTAKTITLKVTPDFSKVIYDPENNDNYYSSFSIAALLVS